MSDTKNRKLDVKVDGKTTKIKNKYGSNYTKTSRLERSFTENGVITFFRDSESTTTLHKINSMIDLYEKRIIGWAKRNGLPFEEKRTSTSFASLGSILQKEYGDYKGAYEAGDVLFYIHETRAYTQSSKFELACLNALNIGLRWDQFIFAINEATLSAGKKNLTSFAEPKLTDEQKQACFKYFDSLTTTSTGRKLTKGERWDKTVGFTLEQFDIAVSDTTLRKAYKLFNK